MNKLTERDLKTIRLLITEFNFAKLFNHLGWSQPGNNTLNKIALPAITCHYRHIAQLASVVVLEISHTPIPDAKTRSAIHNEISRLYHEHLLIFIDQARTQTCWSWLKRDGKKTLPRSHTYFAGQSGDLLLSKIAAIYIDFTDLDPHGNIALVAVTDRLKSALDIEPVTKKFFQEFEQRHDSFVAQISGIDNDQQRAWYASVLLHRLMFIWFLQKKGFIDHANRNYLTDKFDFVQKTFPADSYYRTFLCPLFFQGFAKPAEQRPPEIIQLLGNIRYLNGGLFLPHPIEEQYPAINITDQAFQALFTLFTNYSWNLDDTVAGNDNEINPDVLGYIFEKYINQKSFGAYYTCPEITQYLCDQTIAQLIIARVNRPAFPELNLPAINCKDLNDLLLNLDSFTARQLLQEILPRLTLLDPACGSGAFLVAAMQRLIAIYSAIIGKIPTLGDEYLTAWLKKIDQEHPNRNYYLKKEIIKNNLYGVDIMPEAMEIAKLRLFLALVASVRSVQELEPLPNIDFNLLAGNSLIGLLTVEANKFNQLNQTGDILQSGAAQDYQQVVAEKNRLITNYRDALTYSEDLTALRNHIAALKHSAYQNLNQLLLAEFEKLQIQFEQATWDDKKNKEGKPKKRALTQADIATLQPFHWGYEFNQVLAQGGFDAIITNPPWEVFKPQAKEFFTEYSAIVTKNKMTIKEFEREQDNLLKLPEIKTAWLDYLSRFPFVSLYLRNAPEYQAQTAVVNGKKTGSDINLYKLFIEQSFNLLRTTGKCGIVVPSGIYTDLGATGLRNLLFNHTEISGLFCLENRKLIFEGVHRSFKFVVLTFNKGGATQDFPTAFMRHEVSELANFPNPESLRISVPLIKKLSPDSHSIMEFKSALDICIAEKMLQFPLLSAKQEQNWNLVLCNEFHMTNDSYLFKTENASGRLPLYEGKMIQQFTHQFAQPRYWIDEAAGRQALLGKEKDHGQLLDYQCYRLGFRDVAASSNERTLIATIIPPVFHGNKIPTVKILEENGEMYLSYPKQLLICGIWNSFVVDYFIRMKITTTINFFYLYSLGIPRLTEKDTEFKPIVERAAALICTTPEYDDLKKELRAGGYEIAAEFDRAQLRAELDARIAHLYGLTEAEFAHILSTFPLVAAEIKDRARAEFQKLRAEK